MDVDFPKIEQKILRFWKRNKIFEKSIAKRKKAKNFVFYDGPITVNAKPGVHHVLARIYKDIIPRFKTMQGFRVERKNGWDTHGLPVELEVERELGFKTKKDIEKYGIAKFNRACKKNVQKYLPFFRDLTEKIGYWVDMENPYITYNNDYIETVWWIIKQIHKKGLLYKDYKVVPYCPRCGTSLSTHELAQGYERIKEPAIYVRFKIEDLRFKNTYLLVWTTTPWTLPGNVAIAVNPKFTYVKAKVGEEIFILVKEKLNVLGKEFQVLEEIKGKDLIGLKYQPLYPQLTINNQQLTIYKIIPADFVSIEEGTGLVHIAPAFGEEDMELIKIKNEKLKIKNEPEFPILLNVDEEGKFKKEVKNWAGMYVKDADSLIIEDLKQRNLLFKEEIYEHDYPFCWRCDFPLLYYAKESWFINMQKVKKDLIKNNEKINWIPAHLKEGRFGEWLKDVKDWALSRERYWGTSLPVWQCKNCGHLEIIGSREDLLKQKFSQNKYYLLRHGQSYWQTKYKKIILGWPEQYHCPLTKKGEKAISKVAKKLRGKIDLIFTSNFLRTKQTAEIVKKETGAEIILDERLKDIDHGILIGKKKDELYKLFPKMLERFVKKVPGGESWSECKMRMLNFLKDIDKRYQGKTILIVSHGDPLWLLEGAVNGLLNKEMIKNNKKKNKVKTGKLKKIEARFLPYDEEGNLNFHRPYIDEVKFYCQNCQSLMERNPEVIDCWFDSGSMPFAQYHYPFENKKLIDKRKQFPADYIAEAIDQTRGWFYTLLAISTLLGFGSPYKNVVCLGHVLDEKGEKMSKSKGNVVDPWYIVDKYGADSLRWYLYTVNQPGDAKLFSEKEVEEKLKKFILIFWNCYLFFETYGRKSKSKNSKLKTKNVLDQWIISKLNELILKVSKSLENFDVTLATRDIEKFVVEDLSQWYIRRSRARFHPTRGKKIKKDFEQASATLGFILLTLSKMTAPFIPFLSEHIYQCLIPGVKQSVHLEDWPKLKEKWIKRDLNEKMDLVRKIVSLGLELRAKAKIKVRQPLSKLQIANCKLQNEFINLVKDELNVKEIEVVEEFKEEKNWIFGEEGLKIALNIEITPQLKEEGMIRDFIRQIQELRKKAGLKPRDKISIQFSGGKKSNEFLMRNKKLILKEVKIKSLQFAEKLGEDFLVKKEIEIENEKLELGIKNFKGRK
jgi:isoleucyl-tRNA synthetase